MGGIGLRSERDGIPLWRAQSHITFKEYGFEKD